MNRFTLGGWKKAVSIALSCTIALASCSLTVAAADTVQEKETGGSYYSVTNPPVLDGTTAITLKTGEDFNPESAQYRLFANDFEDGDVTSSLKITENTVNTAQAGNYRLSYTVTDSHGNTAQKQVPVTVGDIKTTQRTLYTLPSVQYMAAVGTNRGNNHDRQNLGIYMPAGSTMRVRQVDSGFGKDLSLTLYADDQEKETNTASQTAVYSIPANGDWVTLTAAHDSVPLIKTPYEAACQPVLEIEWTDTVKPLDYYRLGDDEQAFFAGWDASGASFAVIETERITILVPRKDRNILLRNGDTSDQAYYKFDTLDELLGYYNDFVEQYDRFLGLELDPDNPVHQNVRTKFFAKANVHGVGAAYYSDDHTASNSDSASGYYEKTWLNLHELGHGYEGTLARQELSLVEILNNVFAYYYQQTFLKPGDGGWLGLKIDIEKNMKAFRDAGTDYNTPNCFAERLYSLVNLLDKIGPEEAMAYLERQYREEIAAGNQPGAADSFCRAFGEFSGYNVAPYFDSWGVKPSEPVKAELYENDGKMLYYLRDLVANDQKAETLRVKLGLKGIYDLVDNDDLREEKLTGSVEIRLSIDDFSQISGRNLLIKDGSDIIRTIPITEQTITVTDLPVGIYELELPNTKTVPYQFDYQYLVVQQDNTLVKEVAYTRLDAATMSSDSKIQFAGLSNWIFSTTTYDLNAGTMTVKTEGGQPHVYFPGQTYASIEVLDTQGNRVFFKDYIGDANMEAAVETFPVEVGYQIKIHHKEPQDRLLFQSQCLNSRESEYIVPNNQAVNQNTSYTITPYGLQKIGWDTKTIYNIYQNKLDQLIENVQSGLTAQQLGNKNAYAGEKNKIFSSINGLNDTDKAEYLQQYRSLYNGSAPVLTGEENKTLYVGDAFEPLSYLAATDAEDGTIVLTAVNTQIATDVPLDENGVLNSRGSYEIHYTVSDFDGNTAQKTITVLILDTTSLSSAVAEGEAIREELDQYLPDGQKEFLAALDAASSLLAQGGTQEEIDAACDALNAAIEKLTLKPGNVDKTGLKQVIDVAKGYDLSKYVDDAVAKQAFADALKAAEDVYSKTDTPQEEINKAKEALLDAMSGLRLRADKSSLHAWLEELKSIDLSRYTEESTTAVRTAIAKAEALAAQDLGRDQTALIQSMIAEMRVAKEQLSLAVEGSEDTQNPAEGSNAAQDTEISSKSDESSGNGLPPGEKVSVSTGKPAAEAPRTGDSMPYAALSVLAIFAAGAAFYLKKRKA